MGKSKRNWSLVGQGRHHGECGALPHYVLMSEGSLPALGQELDGEPRGLELEKAVVF